MAVSQFTTWTGEHTFTNFILTMNYAVFADMSNGSAQPYIRLNNCRVRSARDNYSQIGSRVPVTIKMQLNGTGTTYTFSSGNSIQHHNGSIYDMDTGEYTDGFYYVDFSSGTNINIPKNGTPFTINLTVTTKSNESYSITEHACGPLSNTLKGPASMYTGNVATYTLQNAIRSDSTYYATSEMMLSFPTAGQHLYVFDGYSGPYRRIEDTTDPFTSISYVPMRGEATVGDISKYSADSPLSYVEFKYYYITGDNDFGSSIPRSGVNVPKYKYILISYHKQWITVTARSEVNAALRPEFDKFVQTDTRVASQITKYGGVVQGHANYKVYLRYKDSDFTGYNGNTRLKYGSYFYTSTVTDYLGQQTVTSHPTGNDAYILYDHGLMTKSGENLVVQYSMQDSFGFITSYTDRITVLPYHSPQITTHRVRRCSMVESGSGVNTYEYEGSTYQLDDYGEYALIEWGVNVTSLGDINTKTLVISGIGNRTISLSSYSCNGYFVVAASGERSYDLVYTLKDDFETTKITEPLNTALAAIDFMRGGTGLALGKVAETPNMMDIHRNWLLKMPYNTQVGNYNGNVAVRLRDWMDSVETRMNNIINNRDVLIYGEAKTGSGSSGVKFWDGNMAVSLPAGSATVNYPYDAWLNDIYVDVTAHKADTYGVLVGVLIGDNITVTRNYLYVPPVTIQGAYCGAGSTASGPKPGIYICSTKPTSINQSTGRPNATIIASETYTGAITYYGGADAYSNEYVSYISYGVLGGTYYDVSSYKGQKVWVCIVTRNGGTSPHGVYTQYQTIMIIDKNMRLTNRNS